MGEEKLGESARSSVTAINAQAEKLRFLIDSLVKLSRLENGILSLALKKGYIKVKSVVGEGAMFSVFLPRG